MAVSLENIRFYSDAVFRMSRNIYVGFKKLSPNSFLGGIVQDEKEGIITCSLLRIASDWYSTRRMDYAWSEVLKSYYSHPSKLLLVDTSCPVIVNKVHNFGKN